MTCVDSGILEAVVFVEGFVSLSYDISILFISSKIIYLLCNILKDENSFQSFETWNITEGLAEYYLKKIMGDTRFFDGQQKVVKFFEECEKEGNLSAVELYRRGISASRIREN